MLANLLHHSNYIIYRLLPTNCVGPETLEPMPATNFCSFAFPTLVHVTYFLRAMKSATLEFEKKTPQIKRVQF